MKLIILILLLSFGAALNAQSINTKTDTIKWSCTNLKDLKTNSSAAHQCKFISYGSQKLKWVQSNGAFITEWTITGVTGSWTDAKKPGNITFAIASEQQGVKLTGQISFNKTAQDFFADLKISGGPSDINFRYQISSNEKN